MAIILPNTFQDAVRSRRLLPFVGAGFSKNIDKELPDWSEVIKFAASILDYDPEILTLQGDYLQIAEYLSITDHLDELYTALANRIQSACFSVANSRCHQLIPRLDVPYIFTTNWDNWLERGFDHEGIPYSKIISHEDFVIPKRYGPEGAAKPISENRQWRETTIVKYHGDFENPKSIVFRETDYFDRLDFEHPLDIKLRSELIGRSVLFIGYSFTDPNVRYIWHKLNKVMRRSDIPENPKSFFVTHFNNPLQIELFHKKGIETIILSPRNIKGDLETLLEQIIELQDS